MSNIAIADIADAAIELQIALAHLQRGAAEARAQTGVTFHRSHVSCHMSQVTCHLLGGAGRWGTARAAAPNFGTDAVQEAAAAWPVLV